jgi:hypothetical protein
MRKAPFLLIGEGISEIQKTIISGACWESTALPPEVEAGRRQPKRL